MLTYAVGKAAHTHSGWPFCRPEACRLIGGGRCKWRVIKWPISGRWLLTLLFVSWVFVLSDVTRALWEIYFTDFPTETEWSSVAVRALPVPIGPWVFFRQWSRGLTNDKRYRVTQPEHSVV